MTVDIDMLRFIFGEPPAACADAVPKTSSDHHYAAARGSLASQRWIAAQSFVSCASLDGDIALAVLIEGTVFARMATCHGLTEDMVRLVHHQAQLASWLQARGRSNLATFFSALGLLDANNLADAGHDEMSDLIALAGEELPSAVFEEVQRIRENIAREDTTCPPS